MENLGTIFTDTSRIHHRFHHSLFESYGLHRGQQRMFQRLYGEDPMSQTELARRMNVSTGTVTRMVQNLEKKGYVARHVDEKDQRYTRLALTAGGNELYEKMIKRLNDLDEVIFQPFTPDEKEILKEMLVRIQGQLLNELNKKEIAQ